MKGKKRFSLGEIKNFNVDKVAEKFLKTKDIANNNRHRGIKAFFRAQ